MHLKKNQSKLQLQKINKNAQIEKKSSTKNYLDKNYMYQDASDLSQSEERFTGRALNKGGLNENSYGSLLNEGLQTANFNFKDLETTQIIKSVLPVSNISDFRQGLSDAQSLNLEIASNSGIASNAMIGTQRENSIEGSNDSENPLNQEQFSQTKKTSKQNQTQSKKQSSLKQISKKQQQNLQSELSVKQVRQNQVTSAGASGFYSQTDSLSFHNENRSVLLDQHSNAFSNITAIISKQTTSSAQQIARQVENRIPLHSSQQKHLHMLNDYFQKKNFNAKINPEGRSNSQAVRGNKIRDGLGLHAVQSELNNQNQITPAIINRDALTASNRQGSIRTQNQNQSLQRQKLSSQGIISQIGEQIPPIESYIQPQYNKLEPDFQLLVPQPNKYFENTLEKYKQKNLLKQEHTPLKYTPQNNREQRIFEINQSNQQHKSLEPTNHRGGYVSPEKDQELGSQSQFQTEVRQNPRNNLVHKLQPINLDKKHSGSQMINRRQANEEERQSFFPKTNIIVNISREQNSNTGMHLNQKIPVLKNRLMANKNRIYEKTGKGEMPLIQNVKVEETTQNDPNILTFYQKGPKMNNNDSSRDNLMSDGLYSDFSPINFNTKHHLIGIKSQEDSNANTIFNTPMIQKGLDLQDQRNESKDSLARLVLQQQNESNFLNQDASFRRISTLLDQISPKPEKNDGTQTGSGFTQNPVNFISSSSADKNLQNYQATTSMTNIPHMQLYPILQPSQEAEMHRQAIFSNWNPEAPRPKSRHPIELNAAQLRERDRVMNPAKMYDSLSQNNLEPFDQHMAEFKDQLFEQNAMVTLDFSRKATNFGDFISNTAPVQNIFNNSEHTKYPTSMAQSLADIESGRYSSLNNSFKYFVNNNNSNIVGQQPDVMSRNYQSVDAVPMPKVYSMHKNNVNLHSKLIIKPINSSKIGSAGEENQSNSSLISQRSLIRKTNEYIKQKQKQDIRQQEMILQHNSGMNQDQIRKLQTQHTEKNGFFLSAEKNAIIGGGKLLFMKNSENNYQSSLGLQQLNFMGNLTQNSQILPPMMNSSMILPQSNSHSMIMPKLATISGEALVENVLLADSQMKQQQHMTLQQNPTLSVIQNFQNMHNWSQGSDFGDSLPNKQINFVHNHGNSASSVQTDHEKNKNSNPFLKGPKLHLFKKCRRLKTSSATRSNIEKDDESPDGDQDGGTAISQGGNQGGNGGGHSSNQTTSQTAIPTQILNQVQSRVSEKQNPLCSIENQSEVTIKLQNEKKKQINMKQNPYLFQVKTAEEFKSRPQTTAAVEQIQKVAESVYQDVNVKQNNKLQNQRNQTVREASNSSKQSAESRKKGRNEPNLNGVKNIKRPIVEVDAYQSQVQSFTSTGKKFMSPNKNGGNVIVNTQNWQDAFKYSFYNANDGMKSTQTNFNKTQLQGSAKNANISRSKHASRNGNSSHQSSQKSNGDKKQKNEDYYCTGSSNNFKQNQNKPQQTLDPLYQNAKLTASDTKKKEKNEGNEDFRLEKENALQAKLSDTAQTPCFIATPQLTGQNWNQTPVINVHITNNITVQTSPPTNKTNSSRKDDLRKTLQNFSAKDAEQINQTKQQNIIMQAQLQNNNQPQQFKGQYPISVTEQSNVYYKERERTDSMQQPQKNQKSNLSIQNSGNKKPNSSTISFRRPVALKSSMFVNQ